MQKSKSKELSLIDRLVILSKEWHQIDVIQKQSKKALDAYKYLPKSLKNIVAKTQLQESIDSMEMSKAEIKGAFNMLLQSVPSFETVKNRTSILDRGFLSTGELKAGYVVLTDSDIEEQSNNTVLILTGDNKGLIIESSKSPVDLDKLTSAIKENDELFIIRKKFLRG